MFTQAATSASPFQTGKKGVEVSVKTTDKASAREPAEYLEQFHKATINAARVKLAWVSIVHRQNFGENGTIKAESAGIGRGAIPLP